MPDATAAVFLLKDWSYCISSNDDEENRVWSRVSSKVEKAENKRGPRMSPGRHEATAAHPSATRLGGVYIAIVVHLVRFVEDDTGAVRELQRRRRAALRKVDAEHR